MSLDHTALGCAGWKLRLSGLEVAIEQVRRNRQVVFAVRGDDIFAFPPGFDTVQLHEPLNTLFAHLDAVCTQFLPDSRPAVFAFAASMGCLDVDQQRFVADTLPERRWPDRTFATPMLKVSAGTDIQYFTLQCDRPLLFMSSNPGVLHANSRAKYTVAS